MLLSTPLAYAGDPRAAADQVAALEDAGLDLVWVAEAYGFDSPTLMGYLAARTERVQIGAGILNIYSRTPGALLQTVAGLDNVSQGRAVLGLGASGPQVIEGFHGVPYDRSVSRTREIVGILRRGLRRETLTNEGLYPLPLPADRGTGLGKPLKLLTRPTRDRVPIYVAALGPTSVASMAAYADGWLPFLFVPERADEVWGEALREGAQKRDPDLGPLEVSAGGLLAITEEGDDDATGAALDQARATYALYVGGMGARGRNFYFDLACRYGWEAEAVRIQDAYLDGRHRDAAAEVPAEWLRLGNLVGPASYVRERVEAFRAAGVTNLQVTPVGPDPVGAVRRVREWVS